jgi:hypothetical protein
MNCKNLGHLPGCDIQTKTGNTYEITINDTDRIIVTVKSKFVKKPIKTIISPRGIEQAITPAGQLYHKVDWSIKEADKEYYD